MKRLILASLLVASFGLILAADTAEACGRRCGRGRILGHRRGCAAACSTSACGTTAAAPATANGQYGIAPMQVPQQNGPIPAQANEAPPAPNR